MKLLPILPQETAFWIAATIAFYAALMALSTLGFVYVLLTFDNTRLAAIQVNHIVEGIGELNPDNRALNNAAVGHRLREIKPAFQEMLERRAAAHSEAYAEGYAQGVIDAGI